jgi:hypothetical protein
VVLGWCGSSAGEVLVVVATVVIAFVDILAAVVVIGLLPHSAPAFFLQARSSTLLYDIIPLRR